MAGLVPSGTPDPDADRRFAERPFPLLQPVGWTGERHRGGYGVRDPGDVTTSLGLILGPTDAFVSRPRLAIDVGSGFPFSVTDPESALLLRSRLVGRREELLRPPRRDDPTVPERVFVEIEGDRLEFDALRRGDRWLAQGRWHGFAVQLHGTLVDSASVRLEVATALPER